MDYTTNSVAIGHKLTVAVDSVPKSATPLWRRR